MTVSVLKFTVMMFLVLVILEMVLVATSSFLRANNTGGRMILEASVNSSLVSAVSSDVPTERCHPSSCLLPDCRCVGTDIPGQLQPRDIPQMVLLTVDDAVPSSSRHHYQGLFLAQDPLTNPNGCPATATFFVSETSSNMFIVKALAERGHELASHSLTHDLSIHHLWSPEDWDREIPGMRQVLATGAGLDIAQVRGMRSPRLLLGGDAQFSMLTNRGFLYDSSMYGGSLEEKEGEDPLWPFTLHFPPFLPQPHAVCDQAYCPTRSYPKLWEVPLVRQYTLRGQPCAMTDCRLNEDTSKDQLVAYFRHNFHRHYSRNRAPFMISVHPRWFSDVPASYPALKEFLHEISLNPDVWQVTLTQMLDWVRHPRPLDRLSELPSWQCAEKLGPDSGIVFLFVSLTALLLCMIVMSVALEFRHAGILFTGFRVRRFQGGKYQHLPMQDPNNSMEERLLK